MFRFVSGLTKTNLLPGALKHLKKIRNKMSVNRDAIAYYSLLVLVLFALGTAAYRYRSIDYGENEETQTVAQESVQEILPSDHVLMEFFPEKKEKIPVSPIPSGEIIGRFSETELVWFSELTQWQTHEAVDFAAAPGEAVYSVLNGTITDVYSDPLYGNTVVIDHGDGKCVEYASLLTLEMVERGMSINRGDIIGSAGTCPAESEKGIHVHIGYLIDGRRADIMELLEESDIKASENLHD